MAAEISDEIHEIPLADRIIGDEVTRWLETGFATALAGLGDLGDEAARRAGIEEMQYLHLSGHHYALVPRIVDALTRAGLLTDAADE